MEPDGMKNACCSKNILMSTASPTARKTRIGSSCQKLEDRDRRCPAAAAEAVPSTGCAQPGTVPRTISRPNPVSAALGQVAVVGSSVGPHCDASWRCTSAGDARPGSSG